MWVQVVCGYKWYVGTSGMWVQGCVGMRVCGYKWYVGMRVCGYVGTRVCGYEGMWVQGYVGMSTSASGLVMCSAISSPLFPGSL